ncbi:MAG: VWA domain-containing protein [Bryobacteraceae bacterium]|nr:VWA domain-containing protein [Bryobacteraceae bacterium]
MFLLNLSVLELLTLFTAVGGVVVTLYLLSRSRRRQTVPTLRFWVHAAQPVPSSRRRRIQQPWSLLLQLISLALLILAIAQLKLGTRETSQQDHVLLLDASSWMGVRGGNNSTLLDEAKGKARAWVRSLGPADRVMVVRVDGVSSPVTAMEADRRIVLRAIDETGAGASALNLDQAFLFANQIRRLHNSKQGEIVYAGAGRVGASGTPVSAPANLRLLSVEGPRDNVGLQRLGARRSDKAPEVWDVFVAVHNYSALPRRVPVTLLFGGAPAGSTFIEVRGGATETFTFHHRTRAAGWMEARIPMRDSLPDDNRAILELPGLRAINVAVYTDQPDAMSPLLKALPQVKATYYTPAEYRERPDVQVVIADRFVPEPQPKSAVLYLEPPENARIRVRSKFSEARPIIWRAEHEITSGLRSRDLRIPAGQVLIPAAGDIVLADAGGSAVALVRPETKAVVLGFHPIRSDLRFDLTTPLLMANVLRWMQPDAFRIEEVHGISVGTITALLDTGAAGQVDPKNVRVLADKRDLPFTVEGNTVRFFSAVPGVVRVLNGDREQVYSLSLPEVADADWAVPQSVRKGIPPDVAAAVSRDLWQLLAIAGALGLLAEWLIFGRRRLVHASAQGSTATVAASEWRKAS